MSESSRSESGDGSLERVYSLSALDALLQDTAEKGGTRVGLNAACLRRGAEAETTQLGT